MLGPSPFHVDFLVNGVRTDDFEISLRISITDMMMLLLMLMSVSLRVTFVSL